MSNISSFVPPCSYQLSIVISSTILLDKMQKSLSKIEKKTWKLFKLFVVRKLDKRVLSAGLCKCLGTLSG